MKKYLWLLLVLYSSFVFSQKNLSLKQALTQITTEHQVVFSYNDATVKKVQKVTFPSNALLTEKLLNLSAQTQLVFEKVDEEHYIIREQNMQKVAICGTVYSAETHQKLPFVNVYYKGNYLQTNAAGFFGLKEVLLDGVITLHSFEYQSKTIAVKDFNTSCSSIFLKENVNKLSEVVITNYLTKGFTKNKDGSILLQPKKMGVLPGVIEPDVLQTLQLIPGVQSPDETASGIHIRGSTPDQNLVVFDGMKMYHFSHFFGLISAFNPYITNTIKLFRSGTHAKYGNNVGGVLDIGVGNGNINKASFGIGSTLTHVDLFLETPIIKDKLGVVFSARRSITDLAPSITYQKYANVVFQNSRIAEGLDNNNLKIVNAKNDFYYEDYHAKIIAQPTKKNQISFSYLYNANNLNFTGNTPSAQENFEDEIFINNNGFRVVSNHQTSLNNKHQLAITHTEFSKDYDGSRIRTQRNGNTVAAYFEKINKVKETMLEYLYEFQTPKKNQWQIGYQASDYGVSYNFFRQTPIQQDAVNDVISGTATNYAIFGEYQYKSNNKWLVNAGVRLQHFNNVNKNFIEPRLVVNYQVNAPLSLKGTVEFKHQAMSQVIDFRNDGLGGLFDRFWALSNANRFPVLESFQSSIGLDYQKKGWTLNVEVFQKNIHGILFLMDENIRGRKYFSGANSVQGLDVLVKKQWKTYTTWLSYSLSKSQYQFANLNGGNAFDGSYDAPHNFIWSHNYQYQQWALSVGWRFRSGIPYTQKTAVATSNNRLRIDFENLNTKRLPNYQRVDVTGSYKFFIGKQKKLQGMTGITLQNITNKRNILNRDYEIQTIITGTGPNRREEQVLVETDRWSLPFVPNFIFRLAF